MTLLETMVFFGGIGIFGIAKHSTKSFGGVK